MANLKQQCEKNEQNTETLQHLITALKTQVELTRTEGDLKVKEETQKRIDCSKQFQVRACLCTWLYKRTCGDCSNKCLPIRRSSLFLTLRLEHHV